MKRNSKFIMLGVIALTGVTAFTSCSSDESAPVNPTFDGQSVKTQFTIAFPGNVAKTRMTGSTVQVDENITSFRGMDNIVLYPFGLTGAAGTDPILSTSTKLGEAIDLTTMIKPDAASVTNTIPATKLLTASNSVLYKDVTIPVGTGSFLFYGKAIDNTTYTDKFYNGSLTMVKDATTPNPANIFFNLDPVYTATSPSTVGAALATYLTGIAQATNWAECADAANSSQTWYNPALGDLYTSFKALKAGSSLDVQAAVQDLYSSIWKNTDAVSEAIKAAILNSTYAADSESPADGNLEFTAALGNTDATYFPGDVNLPDGAALLTYTEGTKTFSQSVNGADNTGLNAKYADFVYPSSLYYYANSGIGTATASQETKYNGTDNWTTILGNYAKPEAVKPSTRSVAILDAIQYAVGRLDMTVKAANTKLYDRNGNEYTLPTGGFTVTGMLIGGQKQVKYDFTTNTETGVPEYVIYDNITKSRAGETALTATTTASAPNYTLALETVAETNVNVAVELVNNGEDFVGVDGVVPSGCKFYLVATLNPTTEGSNGATGVANTGKKVFKQDYKTIANFTITQGTAASAPTTETINIVGLGAAYNTIPDLRTPKLELGLSVDLKWEEGITFTQNL